MVNLSATDTKPTPVSSAGSAIDGYSGNYNGTVPGQIQVYMGNILGDTRPEIQNPISSQTMTTDQATQSFYQWAPVEQQAFTNKLYRAGIISSPSDFQSAVSYWTQAVAFAGNQFTYGHKKITPWDVVQQSLGLANAAKAKANLPSTTTNTSTAVQVLTNGDANSMINAMYQNELGRNPTDGELSRYRSMLINTSKADPQVTTTRTTSTPDLSGRNTTESTSSTQKGGWSSAGLNQQLQGNVQADPEYGAYQAATTYMGALENAMSGAPNLVAGGSG